MIRKMAGPLKSFLFYFLLLKTSAQEVEYDLEAWTKAAAYLQSAMDTTVAPCTDFYDFMCGRYNDSGQTGTYKRAVLEKLSTTARILEKAIAKIDLKKSNTPKYKRAIRAFHDRCSSQTLSSKEIIKQAYDAVATRLGPFPLFGSVPADFDVWRTLGILEHQADLELGYSGRVVTPSEGQMFETAFNTTTTPVVLFVPSTMAGNFNSTKVRGVILLLADILGKKVDNSQVDDLVNRIESLYTDLTTIPVDDSLGTGQFYSLSNATSKYPYLGKFLETALTTETREPWAASGQAQVRVQNEDFLQSFAAVTKNSTHKNDAWQALAFLKVLGKFEEEYFGEYDSGVLVQDTKSINERCLDYVVRLMAAGAARLYLDYIGEDIGRWRSEIQLMARNIFAAFRFMINGLGWLDDEDKVKINEKIDTIKFYPGIPDWITDDEKVLEHMYTFAENASLYENELASKTKKFDHNAAQLVNGPNTEDPPPSFELSSEYNVLTRTITTFLGYILPPYYQPTYPLSVKYGGFGFVIGHELAHAFDSQGVYDPASPKKPWLKQSTLKEFEKRKACLVDQYSQYCYKKLGACVNGEQTVGDNIADIDGLKAAYLAYKYVAKTIGGDIPVPQMYEYSSDQIFFMSATRQWCTNKEDPTSMSLTDDHTPDRARIEIATRNVPQFALTYNCRAGSNAVPAKSCPIWGDFNGAVMKTKKPKQDKKKQNKEKAGGMSPAAAKSD